VIFITSPFAHTDFLINEVAWLQVRGNIFFYGVSWGKQRRKAACLQVVARSHPFVRNIFSSDEANKCICTKSCLTKNNRKRKTTLFYIIL